MSGLKRFALVVVVSAVGLAAFVVDPWRQLIDRTDPHFAPGEMVDFFREPIDSYREPIDRTDPSMGIGEMVDSFQEPTILSEVPADIRKIEQSRRAERPAGPKRKTILTFDEVLTGGSRFGLRAKPAEPMPPTACRSVEPAPKHTDHLSGPHYVHDLAVSDFETSSGFGAVRMMTFPNKRGTMVASPAIDRVELVSLLTDSEPSVYVLDEIATPPLARQARRRPLDEFERLGLDAVRRGEYLLWTREAPTRMFGAIRARTHCLECHANAKRGDLLGAFTYYLNKPVDQLADRPRE